MADEQSVKAPEKPAEGVPPASAAPTPDAPPAPAPEWGGVPNLDIGGGKKKNWLRSVTLPTWLLALVILSLGGAFWKTYQIAFQKGTQVHFKADLASMKLKTPFSDPMYPILNVQANLQAPPREKQSLLEDLEEILREAKTMEWDPEEKNLKKLAQKIGVLTEAAIKRWNPKYVSLSLHLSLTEDEGLKECSEKEEQLRDLLVALLSSKSEEEVDSSVDQNRLKRLIRDELNASLTKARVKEVHFSQFRMKLLFGEKPLISKEE